MGIPGHARGGFSKGPDLATEMGIFGKVLVHMESILVLSHEDNFRSGFGATMRPFVKLL